MNFFDKVDKMDKVDKVIKALSPIWAMKREEKRENARYRLDYIRSVTNSGYSHHGASKTKQSILFWRSDSKSPSEDITENLELMRERSRDLYADGALTGRGAIERVVLNVEITLEGREGNWRDPWCPSKGETLVSRKVKVLHLSFLFVLI
ncbi:MAG: hypothetical protein LBJ36_09270 [Synergistaceae bacterium]|nr:hypothetical protein [Synergistaceae bacterium]